MLLSNVAHSENENFLSPGFVDFLSSLLVIMTMFILMLLSVMETVLASRVQFSTDCPKLNLYVDLAEKLSSCL